MATSRDGGSRSELSASHEKAHRGNRKGSWSSSCPCVAHMQTLVSHFSYLQSVCTKTIRKVRHGQESRQAHRQGVHILVVTIRGLPQHVLQDMAKIRHTFSSVGEHQVQVLPWTTSTFPNKQWGRTKYQRHMLDLCLTHSTEITKLENCFWNQCGNSQSLWQPGHTSHQRQHLVATWWMTKSLKVLPWWHLPLQQKRLHPGAAPCPESFWLGGKSPKWHPNKDLMYVFALIPVPSFLFYNLAIGSRWKSTHDIKVQGSSFSRSSPGRSGTCSMGTMIKWDTLWAKISWKSYIENQDQSNS